MKKEQSIKQMFYGTVSIDRLHEMHIRTISQLKKRCLGPGKRFIRLTSDTLKPGELQNLNWSAAHFLAKKKLVTEIEVTKQQLLSCYYTILKKRARKALIFNNLRTIGDIYDKCLEDGVFRSLKGKKIGPRVNYETALLLKHLNFLSEKEFLKVPLPSWKTRLLTDKEVCPDGRKKIHKMTWSKDAKELIIQAVSLKFREYEGFPRSWHTITLGEVVKTFVRIDGNGSPCFYTKGHKASRWYTIEWFMERFDDAFQEIEKKLYEFGYLISVTEQNSQ